MQSKSTSHELAVVVHPLFLLQVPAVAADEEVACVCGDDNAGGRRNLEGRAFVPSRLCCLHHPVPPFASSGMHRHARRRESLTHHHERTCREKQVCPTGSRSSCVSALSNTLLHFASRPRRRLGTYLYIMMPALPQDIASLLTSGARCWQCSLHVT